MASKRELVLQAVEALLLAALPNAKHLRNKDRPTRTEPGGIEPWGRFEAEIRWRAMYAKLGGVMP